MRDYTELTRRAVVVFTMAPPLAHEGVALA